MSTRTRATRPKPATPRKTSAGPIAFFVALFIIALGLIQLVSTFHSYALDLSELNSLRKQEAALVAQKKELENDIDRWNDDAYVTAQARERLGYVFPGEQPIRVEHPEAVTGRKTPTPLDGTNGTQESTLPWYSEMAYSFKEADAGKTKTQDGDHDGGATQPDGAGDDKTKEQQTEALTRLDETIKINMQKSQAIGETADRLTRALTGEVKVQGNFGELKLKQLLEDLELKEGEQFDTQETLRDKGGKGLKGDDGKGLIPDFILHFPNNRHVVVDSKMSLTDYERYMNAEDGTPEKSDYLKAHIASVRAQVKRLARKEYTRYLPEGYNRLNFAIMYVPIEGALNLALLNDSTLWREAYDEGVMILGPQTMYMNLRVLEMMWTQVRQLSNQQAMMDAANAVIDRVQDFGLRFMDVESSMRDTIRKIDKLKITTADSGPSIITAAKNLLKAGAKENKKKKSLDEMDTTTFLDDQTNFLTS